MYDLAILGGGPAGAAAGVYASRKQLKTVFITESFGGQSTVSPDVQNWIGTVSIPGNELAKKLKEHVEAYADGYLELKEGEKAAKVEKVDREFPLKVTTENGQEYSAKTVLVATGANRRKLDVPGAAEYENKGITYCATCDGPLFSGKDVVVIGGGNAGFETAAQLLAYAKSVTLLESNGAFKADPVTVEKVTANPKMKAFLHANTLEIKGNGFVKSLVYEDKETGEKKEIATEGVFVEIGLIPNTGLLGNLVELDEYKRVVVDPKNQRTSVEGIWAAGDCTNVLYHQNNIAAGDAVTALEDIYLTLRAK
jgi:alkyl hydroperoxide reductase subunit F